MRRMRTTVLSIITLFAAFAASAGPGALEISETCAVHTGCFAGDTAGYPVTITSAAPASSFVLTSDLAIPNANTHGIEIATDRVRVDLGGFTIRGVTTCTGDPNVCSNTGSGSGVFSSANHGIEITNGAISGMGHRCIDLNSESRVSELRIDQCGGGGIIVEQQSVVTDSVVSRATDTGVLATTASVIVRVTVSLTGGTGTGFLSGTSVEIESSSAHDNSGRGFQLGLASIIDRSTSFNNDDEGIYTSGYAVVNGCSVYANGDAGILISAGSIARGNVVANNGSGGTGDDGIHCNSSACSIEGNTSRANTGWGIFTLDATSRYSDNTTHLNTQGAVSGGTDLGGNLLN